MEDFKKQIIGELEKADERTNKTDGHRPDQVINLLATVEKLRILNLLNKGV